MKKKMNKSKLPLKESLEVELYDSNKSEELSKYLFDQLHKEDGVYTFPKDVESTKKFPGIYNKIKKGFNSLIDQKEMDYDSEEREDYFFLTDKGLRMSFDLFKEYFDFEENDYKEDPETKVFNAMQGGIEEMKNTNNENGFQKISGSEIKEYFTEMLAAGGSECIYEMMQNEGFLPTSLSEGESYEQHCHTMMEDEDIAREMFESVLTSECGCGKGARTWIKENYPQLYETIGDSLMGGDMGKDDDGSNYNPEVGNVDELHIGVDIHDAREAFNQIKAVMHQSGIDPAKIINIVKHIVSGVPEEEDESEKTNPDYTNDDIDTSAHDEEEKDKYSSDNMDDVESGHIKEDDESEDDEPENEAAYITQIRDRVEKYAISFEKHMVELIPYIQKYLGNAQNMRLVNKYFDFEHFITSSEIIDYIKRQKDETAKDYFERITDPRKAQEFTRKHKERVLGIGGIEGGETAGFKNIQIKDLPSSYEISKFLKNLIEPHKRGFLVKHGKIFGLDLDSIQDILNLVFEEEEEIYQQNKELMSIDAKIGSPKDSEEDSEEDSYDDVKDIKPKLMNTKDIEADAEKGDFTGDDELDESVDSQTMINKIMKTVNENKLPNFIPVKGKSVDKTNSSDENKELKGEIEKSEESQETVEQKVGELKNSKYKGNDYHDEIEKRRLGMFNALDRDYDYGLSKDQKEKIELEVKTGHSYKRDEKTLGKEANIDTKSKVGEKMLDAAKKRSDIEDKQFTTDPLRVKSKSEYQKTTAITEGMDMEIEKIKKMWNYGEVKLLQTKKNRKINEDKMLLKQVSTKKFI